MARKRTSTFEDLVTLLSRLPWWASLLIGAVSWLILRPVVISPMVAPAGATSDDFSTVMSSQVLSTCAMFGQYLALLIFLFGAIDCIAGRYRSKKMLTANQPGEAIESLSWLQFEHLSGEAFRRQGYSITETCDNGADGGVDLVLRKGGGSICCSASIGVP